MIVVPKDDGQFAPRTARRRARAPEGRRSITMRGVDGRRARARTHPSSAGVPARTRRATRSVRIGETPPWRALKKNTHKNSKKRKMRIIAERWPR